MSRARNILENLITKAINMTERTSLSSAGSRGSTPARPAKVSDYTGVDHPSKMSPLKSASRDPCQVKPLQIKVSDNQDGSVPGFLHLPSDFSRPTSTEKSKTTGAILLSGAGGGVTGPSAMYLSMATKLATLSNGIPVLRLDYRFPARNKYCVSDVLSAMDHLGNEYGMQHYILVGWSFGGAPVFTVGGSDSRVIGCATVASQTAETEGIRTMSPKPVFLLHGTGDRTLSPACSERLYNMYGEKGDRRIAFFDNDDHGLTKNAEKAEEMLCEFIMEVAELHVAGAEKEGIVEKELMDGEERKDKMRKGGDLRGQESLK